MGTPRNSLSARSTAFMSLLRRRPQHSVGARAPDHARFSQQAELPAVCALACAPGCTARTPTLRGRRILHGGVYFLSSSSFSFSFSFPARLAELSAGVGLLCELRWTESHVQLSLYNNSCHFSVFMALSFFVVVQWFENFEKIIFFFPGSRK